MLNIVDDASKAKVKTLVTTIYSAPGMGKTTLALSANQPILFDFDDGIHRAKGRVGKPYVECAGWDAVAKLDPAKDLDGFKTAIVDTAGTALDKAAGWIIRDDAKMGHRGSLTLKGYGRLKTVFGGFLSALREAGIDVVLVCHMTEEGGSEEQKNRIIATGGSKAEIYRQSDLMGQLFIDNGRRVLSFDPSEVAYGKNVGLDQREIKLPTRVPRQMASIIREAKFLMNEAADQDAEETRRLGDLRAHCEGLDGPDDFTALAAKMKKADAMPIDRQVLAEVAAERGFKHDGGVFYDPNANPEPEREPGQEG